MSARVMKSARHTMPCPASASWRKVSPLEADNDGVTARLLPLACCSGQLLPCSYWAKPSNEWPARSSGVRGAPCRAR